MDVGGGVAMALEENEMGGGVNWVYGTWLYMTLMNTTLALQSVIAKVVL